MKVRSWPVAALILAVLWVFVGGAELTVTSVVGALLFGLVVGTPLAFVFRRLYPSRIDPVRGLKVVPYVVLYFLTFVREVVEANLVVAYRILAPGPPIEPDVVLIPLRVETDAGITTLANSITLTPGTLTMDYDPDQNALYVHTIYGRNIEETVEPIRRWERYALVIFDEDHDPGDPAPAVSVDGGDPNELRE